jgi:hypothetical protein
MHWENRRACGRIYICYWMSLQDTSGLLCWCHLMKAVNSWYQSVRPRTAA